ncbi:DUF4105 domain-containing protein [Paraflavitalea pollutisoli]|uniref:Lnb N-terminal periplasmic domain-containing protein n=1 Tax=Paraflavitalea pollutisoli TaxID=3034143 RepID=UPI0023EBE3B0|nr:DUF4105 domain-containing protein [Paraflavitalea sp. H1-2-19X]
MRIVRVIAALLLFLFLKWTPVQAQTDSCNLRISLLTCSPGEELYSAFGHTAIRVVDNATGADIVFNYGTFDDADPIQFYKDFTKGLMYYELSVSTYNEFAYEYSYFKRSVVEQVLQLSCAEKTAMFDALHQNVRPENKNYYYYFHQDNCTTRARDMIVRHATRGVQFPNILTDQSPSYRNLIHEYLDKGHQPWSKFGIDILLGANIDKKVTNDQAMFLPDYLKKAFDNASTGGQKLVIEERTLLPAAPSAETGSWFTPFTLFTTLFLLIAALSFTQKAPGFLRIFDIGFFLLLGLLGTLLLVLWIIRVDDVCRNNWNLLWALPTHLPVVFLLHRKKQWIKTYFTIVFVITLLLAGTWFVIPQSLNIAIAPVLGIILVRSWFRRR